MCIGCPHNPEAEIREMPCSNCRQIFAVDKFYEIAYEEDGLLLFCSKGCKDKWEELSTTEKELV
jgi:hypothetical protein